MSVTPTTDILSITSVNDLPDELLRLISISAGPTEYCNFRRAMKRVWLYNTGREDHCIKHFLITEVNEVGSTKTTLCGKRHSMFDRPAIIYSDGTQYWYQHDERHRDNDLPAIITFRGSHLWYQHGERHRNNDQPAAIYPNGTQVWYQYGEKHRDNDLPSIIWNDGRKYWHQHGERHRDNDLPAYIRSSGEKRWYKHGTRYTP